MRKGVTRLLRRSAKWGPNSTYSVIPLWSLGHFNELCATLLHNNTIPEVQSAYIFLEDHGVLSIPYGHYHLKDLGLSAVLLVGTDLNGRSRPWPPNGSMSRDS